MAGDRMDHRGAVMQPGAGAKQQVGHRAARCPARPAAIRVRVPAASCCPATAGTTVIEPRHSKGLEPGIDGSDPVAGQQVTRSPSYPFSVGRRVPRAMAKNAVSKAGMGRGPDAGVSPIFPLGSSVDASIAGAWRLGCAEAVRLFERSGRTRTGGTILRREAFGAKRETGHANTCFGSTSAGPHRQIKRD